MMDDITYQFFRMNHALKCLGLIPLSELFQQVQYWYYTIIEIPVQLDDRMLVVRAPPFLPDINTESA